MKLTANDRIEAAVALVGEAIERAQARAYSKQPRFAANQASDFFASILHWVRSVQEEEPPYEADSRKRDAWLRDAWKREPHLAGVISTMVSLSQNRGWTLTGGRNQVNRYTKILRDAEDGHGWRRYIGMQAQSFFTADIGAITETGREGRNGPLRALYHVDPAKCRLTGKRKTPLAYDNTQDPWRIEDYFRVVSLPSTDEEFYGLGFCALSRCLDLSKLAVAVYEHSQEKLGSRAPKGLMILQNIGQDQWLEAMKTRDAALDGKMQQYYGAVAVLAGMGPDAPDAKLVALSQLPDGFDLKVWTDLLMYGYALAFEMDPIEFWPVQAGALGRGKETEIQHRKATQKGTAAFPLAHQDQLQLQLPESLLFEYEQRDQEGMMLDAEVTQAWANVAKTLYEQGMGVLNRQQVMSLLATNGVIPMEWTEFEEDVQSSDSDNAEGVDEEDTPPTAVPTSPATPEDELRARLLEREPVRRALLRFPDEPVVQYQWPTQRTKTLWRRGGDALARRIWSVAKPRQLPGPVQRADEDVLYQGEDFTITEADVDRAIQEGRERVGDEFAELLEAQPWEGEAE